MALINNPFITRRNFLKNTTAAAASAAFTAGIRPVVSTASEGNEYRGNPFGNIYRQLHLDAHFGSYDEIYKNFDAEAAAQIIDEAGFQMVSYFSKGWAGYSYYPTKIGVMHPGLVRDFTGETTKALKKKGIKCIVYFMLKMERRLHKEHPEWIYPTMPKDVSLSELASMCFSSPYTDIVIIPQLKEIIELYDVDGFFLDGVMRPMDGSNCHCQSCRERFAKEVGGDIPTDDNDPKAFVYRKWDNKLVEAFMDKLHNELSAIKPGIALLNNYAWMMRYPVTPPPYVQHVCWDTPVPRVGLYSWNMSLEARYLATLPNITWSCMNTRGNGWDNYALREPEAFMSECAILLAGCGRTYLSDTPYPSGNPDPAVMEVFGAVNKRTHELEPFVKDCKPVKDVAILHSADSVWSKSPVLPNPYWRAGPCYHSVNSAHKILIEGHVQLSILNSEIFEDTFHEYRTIILPDQRILSKKECDAIRSFVKSGGALIATCETGTRDSENNLLNNFSLADVLGIDYLETLKPSNCCYLRVKSKIEPFGIPAMDTEVNGIYTHIITTKAETLIELVPPYGKNKYNAPAELPIGPGVTINSYGKGKAIYCAAQLFGSYFRVDTPVLRKLGLWMLGLVNPIESRSISLNKTPINVEMFYNQRGSERFIHLINYSGDKREESTPQVQDFTTVHGIEVRVKFDTKPAGLTKVPGEKKIPYRYQNGWVSFEAEPLFIHDIYRIEI